MTDSRNTCPDECPRKCNKVISPNLQGTGPKDTKILLITDYPDRVDDREGMPLIGNPGRMINSLLRSAGCNRSDVFITCAIKCFLDKEDVKAVGKELKCCREQLVNEINEIKPTVIGTLGAHALKSVLNRTGLTKIKNTVLFSDEFDCKVVPLYHPNYIMRNAHEYSVLDSGIKILVKEAQSKEIDTSSRSKATYLIASNKEQVERIICALEKQDKFVFDLETSSLDYFQAKILCVAVSWKGCFGAVIPWDILIENTDLYNRFVAILQSNKLKINHNIKFDLQILKANKICTKGPFFDTMLAHHLIDENTKHGLDDLTLRYLDLGEYWDDLEKEKVKICKEKKLSKEEFSYSLFEPKILYPYAAKDADATFRLYTYFVQELERQGLTSFFKEHTMSFMPVLMYMEFKGIKIDRDKLKTLIDETKIKIEELEKAFFENEHVKKYETNRKIVAMKKLTDKYNSSKVIKTRYPNGVEEYAKTSLKEDAWRFNFKSPKQLQELFFKQMKLPAIKETPTGLSTDEEVLSILADRHGVEFAKRLIEYRGLTKYCSTYLESVYDKSKYDGRIHTTYQQHITVSGRLSSKDPNLQNINRDAKDFKSCFISDSGYVFVKSDLAQAEFRCWAHYSGDPDMLRDIELVDKGLLPDIHKTSASEVYEIPVEEVTKEQRSVAKAVTFGFMFGRGPKAVAAQFGIPEEQAERVKESFFARYPIASKWLRDTIEQVRETGIIKTWFGRIRRLPKIHSDNMGDRAEAERQALNSPIQGQASDMNNAFMLRIWREAKRRGIDCFPAATIHDDNTLQVKEGQEQQLVEVMKWVVENAFPEFKCKMKLEFKKGDNLGYMEDIEE